MRTLKIYCAGTYAGVLTEVTPSLYTFNYDAEYLKSGGRSISLTLPKSEQTYESELLFPCFSNLLPEGTNRRTICLRHHIDENDSFGLLAFFAGKDIIGDITIYL